MRLFLSHEPHLKMTTLQFPLPGRTDLCENLGETPEKQRDQEQPPFGQGSMIWSRRKLIFEMCPIQLQHTLTLTPLPNILI